MKGKAAKVKQLHILAPTAMKLPLERRKKKFCVDLLGWKGAKMAKCWSRDTCLHWVWARVWRIFPPSPKVAALFMIGVTSPPPPKSVASPIKPRRRKVMQTLGEGIFPFLHGENKGNWMR